MANKTATKKYVVTQMGMQNRDKGGEYEIGDVISLTEAQAAARVGKVVLKSEADSSTPQAKNKLVETVTEQAGQIETLTTANTDLGTQLEALTKANTELVDANATLTTQVELVTAENAKLIEAAKKAVK